MRSTSSVLITLLSCVATLQAAELNLSITSNGQGTIIVKPGATVPYEVTGVLSDTNNEGLSFFIFDLSFDGGPLTPVDTPVSMPLNNFTPPEGFTNPEGYAGAVVDGVLKQVGGSQNTLKSPLMTGAVITGLGHTPIVLATGNLTAPMTDGSYTLTADEVLARVIEQGDDGSGEIWLTEWAFEGELTGLQVFVGPQCTSHGQCADSDRNGIRDDQCLWWSCSEGLCESTDIPFADMGGQFGECPPDGTADGNDRFHALNCFANQNADGSSPYDCESAAPAAFNVDAGGRFGDCNPDGVCDGNDAFHALNAFDGSSSCSCSAGPGPVVVPVHRGEGSRRRDGR